MKPYDDTLIEPDDRECCAEHGLPLPCRACAVNTADDQADWKAER